MSVVSVAVFCDFPTEINGAHWHCQGGGVGLGLAATGIGVVQWALSALPVPARVSVAYRVIGAALTVQITGTESPRRMEKILVPMDSTHTAKIIWTRLGFEVRYASHRRYSTRRGNGTATGGHAGTTTNTAAVTDTTTASASSTANRARGTKSINHEYKPVMASFRAATRGAGTATAPTLTTGWASSGSSRTRAC